ncbi:MAG: myo-inosose-2 dehydratase [Alphaproteobacteria bacterium]|nr:myo-inosose-2 dehydratase [Alphaproteobacteria bacterium]
MTAALKSVRIGINPITWSNDDMPELGGDTSLETCLDEARRAGYDGLELGNKFPRDSEALKPVMARYGLSVVSGWYSARLRERSADAEIAAMQPHLTLLKAMGCGVMVFAETSGSVAGDRAMALSKRPTLSEAEWQPFASRLNQVAGYLASQGIMMAFHHHMGTVIETPAEIDRMMAATGPSVRLLLDTGHLTYAGGDPLATARRHIRRISHVHCKDVRSSVLDHVRRRDSSFMDAVVDGVFTVPGDGTVEYPGLMPILAGAGYRGWLVVEAEQDPGKAHPFTYAQMGCAYLKRIAGAAGL